MLHFIFSYRYSMKSNEIGDKNKSKNNKTTFKYLKLKSKTLLNFNPYMQQIYPLPMEGILYNTY